MKFLRVMLKFKIFILWAIVTLLVSCTMYDPTTSPLVIYPKPSLKVIGHFEESTTSFFSVYPDITNIVNEKLNNNVNALIIDEVIVEQSSFLQLADVKGSLAKIIETNNLITQPHSFSSGVYVKNVKVFNDQSNLFILKAPKGFIIH